MSLEHGKALGSRQTSRSPWRLAIKQNRLAGVALRA